jgi:TonB-linked SusC/RagA family outer membrane protein
MRFVWHGLGTVAVAALLVGVTRPGTAGAQEATLIGRVTSEVGVPLPDASVGIEGFGIGGTTRSDGTYRIPVPAARVLGQPVTLTARLLGYTQGRAQVVLAAGDIMQNFVLTANPLHLGEVVITGEGTQQLRERIATSQAPVDTGLVQRANEMNFVTALAAKTPNVEVVNSSGEPGSSTYIQLRGLTTLTAADGQPLIVVDGVPIDNSTAQIPGFAPTVLGAGNGGNPTQGGTVSPNRGLDLNPNDIADIQVLKGAASGSIYGSRAGQGVILITTKKGQAGATRYTLKSSGSWDHVSNTPYLQRQYGLGTGGVTDNSCISSPSSPPNCFVAVTGSWGAALPAGTPTYDHATEMFTTGHVFDNTLGISGGNERTSFYLAGGYTFNRGMIVGNNNNYARTTLRLNGAQQATSRLRFGANFDYTGENGAFVQSRNNISGLVLGAWRTPPEFNNLPFIDPVTHEARSYRFPNPAPGSDLFSRKYDNPFFVANEGRNTANVGRVFGSVPVEYRATDWLKFSDIAGADYSSDERLNAVPWGAGAGALSSANAPGAVGQGYLKTFQFDNTVSATASWQRSDNLSGNLTLGQNINVRNFSTQQTTGTSLITPVPFNLANTATQALPNVYTEQVHLEGYFGQATAELFKQVSLTGGLRYDGASTFGANNRFSLFPSVAAAWNFIRPDANASSLISSGKLRAALGESGTQPLPYVLSSTVTSNSAFSDGFIGNGISSGQNGQGGLYTFQRAPNPNLKTEIQKEFEAGIDLGLLRDRADASVTYYRETSTGVIFDVPIAPTTGFTVEAKNAGSLWNHGVEFALNLRPITTRAFAWDLGINWARNRSMVTNLSGETFVDLGGTNGLGSITGAAVKGFQTAVYYGSDFVRCGRGVVLGTDNIDQTAGECKGAKKGALYLDATGNPILDTGTQYVIGDPNRNWIGSFHTGVHFHRLSVTGLVDIQNGGQSYNGTKGALNQFGKSLDSQIYRNGTYIFGKTYLPGQAVAGPGVGVPTTLGEGWFTGNGGVFNGPTSLFLEPSGFAKLREISVSYTFDGPWVQQRLGFTSFDIRLAGRNLHTWTKYTGVDPETSILGAQSPVRGIDYFNIPQSRSYVLSVSIAR